MKQYFLLAWLSARVALGIAGLPAGQAVFAFDDATHRATWKLVEGNLPVVFSQITGSAPGAKAAFHINTAAYGDAKTHEEFIGAIQSPPFQITDSFYAIVAGGGNAYNETFVSVLDTETQQEFWRTVGNNSNEMTISPIDLSKGVGRMAVIRLEDRRTSNGGSILFGGIYKTDQSLAQDELVEFHINLLNSQHSRADGKGWLDKNVKARHGHFLEQAVVVRQNDTIHRVCLDLLGKFPSPSSAAALLHAATKYNEFTARVACEILRDNIAIYSADDRKNIENDMLGLMNNHASDNLRITAAGVLLAMRTPTAIAAIQQAQTTAPPKAAHGINFLLKSKNFTRTEFNLPEPGQGFECWLRGMQYYVYLPRTWKPTREWPLLVAVHGTWGHGSHYEKLIQAECNRLGVVAIAPTFDQHRFWGYGHFGGKWRPDLALIEIIQAARKPLNLQNVPCVMFGHSEGAQFVGRFTLVHPAGVKRVAMSGTDELCQPDPTIMFPFGTGPNPDMPGGLPPLNADAWLRVPTLLIVGTKDSRANVDLSEKWAAAVNKFAIDSGLKQRLTFIRHRDGVHSINSNFPHFQKWLAEGFK